MAFDNPLAVPSSGSKSEKKQPESASEESDEEAYGREDESDAASVLSVEVLVQELHDNYSSYGRGKLNLHQICTDPAAIIINATSSHGINSLNAKGANNNQKQNQGKGGWLDLDDGAGKVLYAAKFRPRETLPKMFA